MSRHISRAREGWWSRWATGARYEVARWPLWRWDQNARYLAKSFLHRPDPATPEDAAYWARQRAWQARHMVPTPDTRRDAWHLSAAGDLMWLRDGYASCFSAELARRMGAADLLIANLETPIDPAKPVKRWVYETLHYNAPPDYLDAIVATRPGRATALSVCNNHALDQGLDGLIATREQVTARGMACVGGAQHDEAIAHLRAGDLSIAIVGLTFGVNGVMPGQPMPAAGIPIAQHGDPRADRAWDRIAALLARARAHSPDLLIVAPHWGYEYEHWPDAAMRADAHTLVSLGADVILGTSPHVLQPVEVVSVDGWDTTCPAQVTRGGPPRGAVIAYSLGNFASIMPTLPCTVGALLHGWWRRDTTGTPQPVALAADPTLTGRAFGEGWLAARTITLDEHLRHPTTALPAGPHVLHARALLSPLYLPPTPTESTP